MIRVVRNVSVAVLLLVGTTRAELVFGNLGADGSTALGTLNNDVGPGLGWVAQGFGTGTSSSLQLQSVTLGLFGTDAGTIPLTVSIFTGVVSGPNIVPNTSLYTSAVTNVGTTGKYTFTFSNSLLQANTTYFVIPAGGSWYFNTGSPAAPVGQNGSGYVSAGTWESFATNSTPVGPWEVADFSRYSLSIMATGAAVPEPGTWAAAALLVGGAAYVRWRKRTKAV
jgi:hypothetical protein